MALPGTGTVLGGGARGHNYYRTPPYGKTPGYLFTTEKAKIQSPQRLRGDLFRRELNIKPPPLREGA